jgi:hypothetical protein
VSSKIIIFLSIRMDVADPITSVEGKIAAKFLLKKDSTDNIVTRSPFDKIQFSTPLNLLASPYNRESSSF